MKDYHIKKFKLVLTDEYNIWQSVVFIRKYKEYNNDKRNL